jgi:probable blue pigment (indigoidine) exporter
MKGLTRWIHGEPLLAVVLWGAMYPGARLALREIPVLSFTCLRLGDHLDGRRWGGLLVGLTGVCLVVRGAAGGLHWSHTVGDLLAIAGAAAWVWFSLAFRPVVGSLGMWQATGLNLGIAALVLSPFALFEAAHNIWWSSVSREAWGGLLYAAVVGGVVSTALWGRSMVRLGSRQTMVYAYLEPVSAVVLAAVVLGESLTAIQAAGALLTLLGVWLASDSGTVSK